MEWACHPPFLQVLPSKQSLVHQSPAKHINFWQSFGFPNSIPYIRIIWHIVVFRVHPVTFSHRVTAYSPSPTTPVLHFLEIGAIPARWVINVLFSSSISAGQLGNAQPVQRYGDSSSQLEILHNVFSPIASILFCKRGSRGGEFPRIVSCQ